RDLADALAREEYDLGDDLARPPALLAAADGRDDAVGAARVAAHRDLHPRLVGPLPPRRQVGRERAPLGETAARSLAARAEPLAEMRDRAGPEGDVDVRIELEEPVALSLGVAAADGD